MELAKNNGPVTTVGGVGETSNFKIAMNAKAFRVLSDTLYQDKIGSIVREISCNALDGHIMAGRADKPFSIHMPDQFEPWFTVRDYGVGLSPESVNTVFCVYFESTKDQSNDAVGAFGLGAKTPFAYTDQFNVISIWNGRKYAYSAFINGSGIPEIQLMAESDTTDHDGVEIRIGVKPEDFNRFEEAVKNQLRFFPVKPEIENYTRNGGVFAFKSSPEYLFETNAIKIYKNAGYGTRVHIVQGPVGYPLDFNQVSSHLDADARAFLTMIQNIGADLYFNIGQIGVTASREGVEYNTHTIASLKTHIAKCNKELTDWIENQLTSLPNAYEKAKFINDNSIFRTIINGVKMDLAPAYRLANGYYAFDIGTCSGFKIERERIDLNGNKVKRIEQLVSIVKYTRNGMDGFRAARNTSEDDTMVPEKHRKYAIAIRDTGKTPVARMRHYFRENNLDTLYMLQAVDDDAEMDAKFIKGLVKHLGGFDSIVRISAMPDAPRATYANNRSDYSRPTAYLAAAHGGMDLESVSNWTRVYDKLDTLNDDGDVEKAIYVTVDRQRITDVGYTYRNSFADLCRADLVDYPVYGIREKDLDKLADTGIEWIKMEDFVKEKLEAIKTDTAIRRTMLAEHLKMIAEHAVGTRFSQLTGLDARVPLARMIRVRDRAQRLAARHNANAYVQRLSGYSPNDHASVAIIQNHAKKMFDKLPMLQYVTRSGYGPVSGDEAKHLVEYINHFSRMGA